jgi:hypothetical protein
VAGVVAEKHPAKAADLFVRVQSVVQKQDRCGGRQICPNLKHL